MEETKSFSMDALIDFTRAFFLVRPESDFRLVLIDQQSGNFDCVLNFKKGSIEDRLSREYQLNTLKFISDGTCYEGWVQRRQLGERQ